ncbi:hypothetical protein ACQJ1L_05715 [Klebsiella quasipneumoniae subsp. similipneumoniae]|uniref:hypothetical protein n=1 Tax=Klebsiella quasipneumoniae TaxID=1463165 RepID=UPI003D0626B8
MKLVGTSYPPLAKFCPPEFNVLKGCNTIRLGTLFDFRREENEKLRDAGEGTFSYSIEFPVLTKVSKEWIGAFQIDDGGQIRIGEMQINNGDFLIRDINISGSSHNCWVYCISKSIKSAGNITETHQDSWLIPSEKLQKLSEYLASLLFDSLTFADLPTYIKSQYGLKEISHRLSLRTEIREIEYNERSRKIEKEEDLPISLIHEIRDGLAFVKPKSFENEQEVRIAFWLYFDNQKISIENNTKILKLRPIDSII